MSIKPFVPKSILFQVSEAKKLASLFCCALRCKEKPAAKKGGLCSHHYHINFKSKAKQRNKDFTITLNEFRKFCEDNNYIIGKGRRGRRCTIDRRDNKHGYHIWNIQIMDNLSNIRKYHDVDKHVTELPTDHEDYTPF